MSTVTNPRFIVSAIKGVECCWNRSINSKYALCYKSFNRRFGNAAFFGVQNEYTPLKGFPLKSSLNYVDHVPD